MLDSQSASSARTDSTAGAAVTAVSSCHSLLKGPQKRRWRWRRRPASNFSLLLVIISVGWMLSFQQGEGRGEWIINLKGNVFLSKCGKTHVWLLLDSRTLGLLSPEGSLRPSLLWSFGRRSSMNISLQRHCGCSDGPRAPGSPKRVTHSSITWGGGGQSLLKFSRNWCFNMTQQLDKKSAAVFFCTRREIRTY